MGSLLIPRGKNQKFSHQRLVPRLHLRALILWCHESEPLREYSPREREFPSSSVVRESIRAATAISSGPSDTSFSAAFITSEVCTRPEIVQPKAVANPTPILVSEYSGRELRKFMTSSKSSIASETDLFRLDLLWASDTEIGNFKAPSSEMPNPVLLQ